MAVDYKTLNEEASNLAWQLFGGDARKRAASAERLTDICSRADGKDFLLIHNPGGWGSTKMEDLLQWERSIVEGVEAAMEKLGYDCTLVQYFRSERGMAAIMEDIKEQTHFFAAKAKIMASELDFVMQHFDSLRIVMIGVSQGAAFSNAVVQGMNDSKRVYSIELGTPNPYKRKRVTTERTLTLNGNGLMPDALMEWDISTILCTYLGAPFRWLKFRLRGKKVKFTYCINVPGHDYNWDYPEVQHKIEDFLKTNFGVKGAER